MKLCVLIPAYNCAEFLPEVVGRISLRGPDDEIIIVDDASLDDTFAVAAALPRVHADRNEQSLGYGGTSKRLYRIAADRGADFSVNIHGDLGHRPEDIQPVVDKLFSGDCDVVLGSRLIYLMDLVRNEGWRRLLSRQARNNMPLARALGHFGLTWFQNLCFGTRLHSFHDGMRGCNRAAIEWLLSENLPTWYDFDTELLIHAHRHGLRIAEVPIPPNYDHTTASAAPPVRYGLRVAWHALRHLFHRFSARGK